MFGNMVCDVIPSGLLSARSLDADNTDKADYGKGT
jgi:hypothetical protein